jgi:hypothetical protein
MPHRDLHKTAGELQTERHETPPVPSPVLFYPCLFTCHHQRCTVRTAVMCRTSTQQRTCAPCNVNFGAVPVGQTETEVVVLTNGGSSSVTLSAVNFSGAPFSMSNLKLPLTLASGQAVVLYATFSPDGRVGKAQLPATLQIRDFRWCSEGRRQTAML